MATTWNPSDKTVGLALSNANHTATTSSGGNFGVRGSPTSHGPSGKYYLEYSSILSGGGGGRYGFANSGDALGGAGQIGIDPGGNLNASGGSVAMGAVPDGKTIAFAIDFDNGKVWARYDAGSWVGNGSGGADPATNTNGLGIAGFTSPLLPYVWLQNNPAHATLNCGDSAFAQSVPSGFVAWDSIPPPQYFRGTVLN